MNEPWSEETARIAEQAYLAFSDVLDGQLQIIQDKVANAELPPNIHQDRDDEQYPEEFLEWLQENILGDETLASMSDEWEQLFYEWLLGTIMTIGRINYMTVGISPTFDFVDDELLEWVKWRARNSSIQIVGTSAERVRKLIYDVIADGPYSIDKIQAALQRDYAFSRQRARSIARTEVLTSQTTGQFASDMKFADEGLLLGKVWQDSNDSRVRDKHRHAHNQFREFYEPFNVGGQLMMYPRDTEMGASANNTIQCRCTYRLLWKGKDEDKMDDLVAA